MLNNTGGTSLKETINFIVHVLRIVEDAGFLIADAHIVFLLWLQRQNNFDRTSDVFCVLTGE